MRLNTRPQVKEVLEQIEAEGSASSITGVMTMRTPAQPKCKTIVGLEITRTLNPGTALTVAIKFVIVADHSQQQLALINFTTYLTGAGVDFYFHPPSLGLGAYIVIK